MDFVGGYLPQLVKEKSVSSSRHAPMQLQIMIFNAKNMARNA